MIKPEKITFFKNVGEAISTSRKNIGYSQEYLANKIGMSRASIVNIEKGRQHPSIFLLWKLSEVLNAQFVDLLPKFVTSNNQNNPLYHEVIKNKTNEGIISEKSMKGLKTFFDFD